ncbi:MULTISPECIES: helix-turn-helix domain-containing protein [Rhizobium]|uniref:Helix-turn-helix domain-containing protein n=1 Tax=Rhizobium gallicum bv. gallicum R602sp TaxID=1041138 RepID=A0A0B4X7R2_9HYPH|nr:MULTISPECIES: helix-turn-helix domain-containing protein [Rhizobium]AJD42512.1 helix-turn-helix domain-containing protein [Rhizobium gallicum bv. gallicum R602sp]
MDRSDYLGLTIETVARSLTKLRERRIIRYNGKLQRLVRLLDREPSWPCLTSGSQHGEILNQDDPRRGRMATDAFWKFI